MTPNKSQSVSLTPQLKAFCLMFMVGLAAAIAPGSASAGTLSSWSGSGGNGDWATPGNWSTQLDTSGTFDLVFGGTTQVTSTNTIGTVNISSLSFINTGSLSAQAPNLFIISGSMLNLSNATITTVTTATATNAANYNGDQIDLPLSLLGSNTVTLGVNHPLSITGNISGTGSFTFNGGGSSISITYLSGSNSYSGGTLITGGFVATGARVTELDPISQDFALGTGAVTVSGTGTLLVRNNSIISNPLTISGAGAGSGALTGSFGGTSGNVAEYRGSITLAGDTRFSTASAVTGDSTSKLLVSGNVDLGSNLLTLRSQRSGTSAATGLLIEITGTMFGTGGVNVSGTTQGRVLISGSNSYSGGTTITTGTLIVGNISALGTGFLAVNTNGLDLNGQTLSVGTLSGSTAGVIRSGTTGLARLITTSTTDSTYNGTIEDGLGTVGLTKAGAGVLTLTGSNSYTGSTNVDGGVLALSSTFAIGSAGDVTFGGGTLRYSTDNQVDYSSRFANSTGPISIDTNGQTVSYNTAIASTNVGGLTKSGSGTLFLNAANQFVGTTTVNAGTLSGTGSVLGQLAVAAGAVFDPGSSPSATTIFGVGGFSQAAGGLTRMQVNGTTAGSLYDQVLFTGTSKTVSWGGSLDLTLSGSYADYTEFNLFSGFTGQSGNLAGISFAAPGSPYSALSFNGPVGGVWYTQPTTAGQYLTFNQANGVLAVVPEPGTITLAAIGAAIGICHQVVRRRRRLAAA